MNRARFTGLIKLLLALCLTVAFPTRAGLCASVQWSGLADRERVTINLDNGEGPFQGVSRVGERVLSVPLPRPAGAAAQEQKTEAPAGARLFDGWESGPDGGFLHTKSPAFGYIVSRPSATRLVIDIFSDPMGTRWKPQPAATPQAPVQAPQAQAAPQTASPAPASPPAPTPPAQAAPEQTVLPAQAPAPQMTPQAAPVAQTPAAPQPARQTAATSSTPAIPSGAPTAQGTGAAAAPPQTPPPAGQPQIQPEEQNPEAAFLSSRASTDASGPRPPAPPTSRQPAAPAASQAGAPRRTDAAPPKDNSGQAQPAARTPPIAPSAGQAPHALPATPQSAAQSVPLRATDPAGPNHAPPAAGQTNATASAPAKPSRGPLPASGPDYVFRSRLNQGGPEDWDQPGNGAAAPTAGLDGETRAAIAGAPNATAQAPAARPQPPRQDNASAGPTVEVYRDEKGNIVPPPPDPAEVLKAVEEDVKDSKYADALAKLDPLLKNPKLDKERRELVLHRRADMIFALHKDNPAAAYSEIVTATTDAMNYNLKSPRNAAALLRLGYMNLKVDNTYEAAAYFNVLRRDYPNDELIPLSYYYWGDYQFEHKNWQEAADQFQHITQNYQDSPYTREASLGLARAYYQLGYYDLAFKIVEFIERRWPRYYLDYPPILNIMGDVAFRLNQLDRAAQFYWTYYNLEPNGPSADIILARLGDIYSMRKRKKAAQEVYEEAVRRFPDKDGGLVALMRLAEDGLYDAPEITQMYSVFERPYNPKPMEAYRKIINQHPNSALVPLARLKLAMWHLFYKEYTATLDQCSAIVKADPKSDIAAKAKDVALKTFAVMSAESVDDQRYARMREIWERYPILREQQEAMNPESRVALAVSYRDEGRVDEALNVLEPFFLGGKIVGERGQQYSEMALSLALTTHLDHDNWKGIEDLAARTALWTLTPETQRQLNYALALAYENQDRMSDAAPIWQKLYEQGDLPPMQQAYAEYFLARDAEQRRDLENAYNIGQDALSRLLTLARENPDKADTEKIKNQIGSLMSIAETAGHLAEAMSYAEQYLTYVQKDSSDYQGVLYRIAKINQKRGNLEAWEKGLEDIAAGYPNSVYGRTAASELRSARLNRDAARFSPTGRL